MTTMPRSGSQPPRRLPPVLTLIAASRTLLGDTTPDTGAAVRWEGGGVSFRPLPCASFEPFLSDCSPTDPLEAERASSLDWDPLTVWAASECTTGSTTDPEETARARDLLLVDQHRQLEREFWRGDQVQAATPDAPNLWLAQDGVVNELSQDAPLVYALAALQEALGSGSAGGSGCGRGMIHATVQTAALWFAANAIRREGGLLLDVFDNVIVPGVGYDGSSPAGAVDATGETAWAYATGLVDSRLGEISTRGSVDRATNDQAVIAQRQVIAYWDGCCHYGVNVNLCNTACAA